ncbi:MAG: FUSC family protein [Streptosporangiaceae bacterium]
MLDGGVVGRARKRLGEVWSSRLAVPLRPAASGPVRYWQEQVRLAVKGAIAAVGAWALARYAVGEPDPYFAPLAALLGVYPTVAGSLREGARYVAGFLLGAALAIPVGVLAGPGVAGIAVVVVAGVLISGWRRLGDQSPQVTFTALFALLLGGHQPFHYVTYRMVDVAIGVATGLLVNVLVFPPLQLRPAEHAIRQWGQDIARALEDLGAAVADRDSGLRSWAWHERRLSTAAGQARSAARHARESLRWNPRARTEKSVPQPDSAVLDSLEVLTARTRAVARAVPDITGPDGPGDSRSSFRADYATVLRDLADPVRQLADLRSSRPRAGLDAPSGGQRQLEREAAQLPDHSDARGAAAHLARLTGEMLSEIAEHQGGRQDRAGHGDS